MSPTLQAGLGILSPAQSPRSLNPSSQGPCPLRSGLSAFCTAGSPGTWDPELPPRLPGLENLQPRAPLRYRPAPHSRHTLTLEAPLALSLPRHSRNFSFQITLSKPWLFQKCELESCLRAAGMGVEGRLQLLFSGGGMEGRRRARRPQVSQDSRALPPTAQPAQPGPPRDSPVTHPQPELPVVPIPSLAGMTGGGGGGHP